MKRFLVFDFIENCCAKKRIIMMKFSLKGEATK